VRLVKRALVRRQVAVFLYWWMETTPVFMVRMACISQSLHAYFLLAERLAHYRYVNFLPFLLFALERACGACHLPLCLPVSADLTTHPKTGGTFRQRLLYRPWHFPGGRLFADGITLAACPTDVRVALAVYHCGRRRAILCWRTNSAVALPLPLCSAGMRPVSTRAARGNGISCVPVHSCRWW